MIIFTTLYLFSETAQRVVCLKAEATRALIHYKILHNFVLWRTQNGEHYSVWDPPSFLFILLCWCLHVDHLVRTGKCVQMHTDQGQRDSVVYAQFCNPALLFVFVMKAELHRNLSKPNRLKKKVNSHKLDISISLTGTGCQREKRKSSQLDMCNRYQDVVPD